MEAYDQDSKETSLVEIIDSAQRKLLKLQYPHQVPIHQAPQQTPPPAPAARSRKSRSVPQRPREVIWTGDLEWIEKEKADQPNSIRQIPCNISANLENGEAEMRANNWPTRLTMQLMPKSLANNIGAKYFKDSKTVYLNLTPCEALDDLSEVMGSGYFGCVHFTLAPPPPNTVTCNIKIMLLLYTPEKQAFLGFIPNNQLDFVDHLRAIILQRPEEELQQQQQQQVQVVQQHQQQSH